MIARNPVAVEVCDAKLDAQSAPSLSWNQQIADMIKSPQELLSLLELPEALLQDALPGHAQFPVRATRDYVRRMKKGDPSDPLLLQVLPLHLEQQEMIGYSADPLSEADYTASKGILQKYHGRALLITTSACAIHCRYCFRRHFPYSEHRQSRAQWKEALATLPGDGGVSEIILSGGDPLMLNNPVLDELLTLIAELPQISKVRLHTRLPIMLPDRIDQGLLDLLSNRPFKTIMVIHANHGAELDASVEKALARLRPVVHMMLNQTVLLKGVNDDSSTLAALSERLFECGVTPYYLHQLDKVQGAAHFDCGDERLSSLMQALRAKLPGYLVPRLVREIPGAPSKTPIFA
ncbi:Lysine 2,3-aminomutase [Hahella chejuensis KCTC 2396]|uniref:L-lysine 2,3-aminomutase n=1 Tax=Hahella chejuensis (strain KCTC 2396) TaxID=349521 RepID=Q2SBA5_HAHCH|nr:EF-P beta-lysylation protein EpmB [Hahella chejuensis]ABC32069.1 Lysine 2,3-aminomutase [Hahella chejuensis KCTC 2396]